MNLFLKRASLLSLALAGTLAWSSVSATERNWSYTYNSLGLIETADGPRTDVQDVTTYGYDAQGHLSSVTNALGHATQLSNFDLLGNPQTLVDANGTPTSLTYTVQGWLASVSTAGSTTSFEHDAVGQITKVTRGDGSFLIYTWDDARRLTKITNNLGESIEFSLDPMGNRTAQRIKDASNHLTQQQTWVYDELGRLLRSIGAQGQTSQYGYDLNDNPTASTNPKQHSNTQAYDALDRLVSNTDPLNGVTALAYDAQDNLTQVKDPRGVTTGYQYDGLGNLIKQTSPDSGTTTYSHDAAGNVISKTDARGVVTLYRYDALNRLTARQYPANPALNVQYHYDTTADGSTSIGRLTAIQDSGGLIGYFYDARGNLIEQIRSLSVATQPQDESLKYAYDAANQLIGIGYPGGISVTYPRNSAGQVTGVNLAMGGQPANSIASDLSYLPFGPLQGLTWGNGIRLERQYDQDYRLTQQNLGSWQSTYSFDVNGNIRNHSHSLFGSLDYSYDPLDRLSEEKGATQRKTYSYDATGNRKTRLSYTTTDGVEKKVGTQTLVIAPDSNRLQKKGNTVLTLDAAGNTLQGANHNRTYAYNEQGRLSEVHTATSLYANYSYNALGQRTLKRVYNGEGFNYATYSYLYGADGQLLGQVTYGSTGKKTKAQYWIWLDGLPLAGVELQYASNGTSIVSSNTYYLHSDHLYTPRLATDASQKLLWSWNSDAFGVGTPNADVDGDGIKLDMPLRFPGQQYDVHSLLNYNYFRDYDPETGRYVESDPIGLAAGLNIFGYVGANPVTIYDSLGLDAQYVYEKYGYLDGLIINYEAGYRSKGIAEDASFDWARKHRLLPQPGDFNGGGADAIRHCVWSCEMTRRLGGGIGRDIGEMHERDNGASGSEMDRQNNQMGCFIGENGDPNKSCTELCNSHYPDLIKVN